MSTKAPQAPEEWASTFEFWFKCLASGEDDQLEALTAPVKKQYFEQVATYCREQGTNFGIDLTDEKSAHAFLFGIAFSYGKLVESFVQGTWSGRQFYDDIVATAGAALDICKAHGLKGLPEPDWALLFPTVPDLAGGQAEMNPEVMLCRTRQMADGECPCGGECDGETIVLTRIGGPFGQLMVMPEESVTHDTVRAMLKDAHELIESRVLVPGDLPECDCEDCQAADEFDEDDEDDE